jgi:hypothetical protein
MHASTNYISEHTTIRRQRSGAGSLICTPHEVTKLALGHKLRAVRVTELMNQSLTTQATKRESK